MKNLALLLGLNAASNTSSTSTDCRCQEQQLRAAEFGSDARHTDLEAHGLAPPTVSQWRLSKLKGTAVWNELDSGIDHHDAKRVTK